MQDAIKDLKNHLIKQVEMMEKTVSSDLTVDSVMQAVKTTAEALKLLAQIEVSFKENKIKL